MKHTFHIVTLFPDIVTAYTKESIIKRAVDKGKIAVQVYNPRDYTDDTHKKVDDKPFGGGPGMVMQLEPIIKTVEHIVRSFRKKKQTHVVLFSPRARKFTNTYADVLKDASTDIILIAGRYEGIDYRLKDVLKDMGLLVTELSIGNYVLTGGELPALVVLDAMTRRIQGVLGDECSLEEKRVSTKRVYTRPEKFEYKGVTYTVPRTLLSGNHEKIKDWRSKRK